MNEIALRVNNISKNYSNIEAIKDISFDLLEGRILSLVGPSGCGKSTLLDIIAGLEEKSSGSIEYKSNNIGYMLQQDSLFPWLNVYENAILGLRIKNLDTKENIDYVRHLLKRFHLEEFINSYPKELSGGMKQRVLCMDYRQQKTSNN